MRVLHLLGVREDNGGVLSVIRNVSAAGVPSVSAHAVWVNASYQETRQPALDYRRTRHLCGDSFSHFEILATGLRAYFELKALLAKEPFEILHGHTRSALIVALCAARFLKRPVIFSNHNFANRIGLYQWAAKQPNLATVCLTPNMVRHYKLDPARTRIVSDCCHDGFFEAPLSVRRPGAGQSSPLRILGIGNIIQWKNWHLILDALRRLPKPLSSRVLFTHYGPTPDDPVCRAYERELKEFAQREGLQEQVRFMGATNRVREALMETDVFALPSLNEPCSVALSEALALGIPVIVSASGGNVDIVRDGKAGLLFTPEDAGDLAAKIESILAGKAAFLPPAEIRETVRMRSATAVAAEYGRLYAETRLRGHPAGTERDGATLTSPGGG